MNLAIITNDNIFDAIMAENTTLSYICAAIKLNYQNIYIIDQRYHNIKSIKENGYFSAIKINNKIFNNLSDNYLKYNNKLSQIITNEILNYLSTQNNHQFSFSNILLREKNKADLIQQNSIIEKINIKNISNFTIINRLDPISYYYNKQDIKDAKKYNQTPYHYVINSYKKLCDNSIFNFPIDKCDKMAPLIFDKILTSNNKSAISTPTFICSLKNNNSLIAALKSALKDNKDQKIVIKPLNSAQSSGVCGIKFCQDNAINLQYLNNNPINQILDQNLQLIYIQNNLANNEIIEIIKILLYLQSIKINNEKFDDNIYLSNINDDQIIKNIDKIYQDQIIIQPFLEGALTIGDIRVNIMKIDKKWQFIGHTLRHPAKKYQNKIGYNFTTCLNLGDSIPLPPEIILTSKECKKLNELIAEILKLLNNDKEINKQYLNCLELGVDIIPKGDNNNLFLGEINHSDPALAPISIAIHNSCVDIAKSINGNNFTCTISKAIFKKYNNLDYINCLEPMIKSIKQCQFTD